MRRLKNENGYALLIVLLLIVFVSIAFAVYMRGAISHAKQERIVDNSNLTTVAAEAGVEYYTWDLKQYFDEEVHKSYAKAKAAEELRARAAKVPVEPERVQQALAEDINGKLNNRVQKLVEERPLSIIDGYEHGITEGTAKLESLNERGDLPIKVTGTVKGYGEVGRDPKLLDFELLFLIPKLTATEGAEESDGSSEGGGYGR